MKKSAILVAALLAVTAVNPVSAETISDERRGLIYQNCNSIKIQLEKVQKDDSRKRVNLGAYYEAISNRLMMNLNLRLVKNSLNDAEIAEQQKIFNSERERFKNDFIGYSQELDALIDVNCRENQQEFYDKLVVARRKRTDVTLSINRLNDILAKHRESILRLREELTNE